jgi:hypothetical protein
MSHWYTWDSLESFNLWHEAKKAELSYPLISIGHDGLANGQLETSEISIPLSVSHNDYRALVDDFISDGLTLADSPITAKTLLYAESSHFSAS